MMNESYQRDEAPWVVVSLTTPALAFRLSMASSRLLRLPSSLACNAVAESFFSNLKKERIKRRIYASRQEAKSDVFDYIKGFYNRVRRHSHLNQMSPLAFEQLQIGS